MTSNRQQVTTKKNCYVRRFQQAKLQNPGKPRYIKTRRQVTKDKTCFKIKKTIQNQNTLKS